MDGSASMMLQVCAWDGREACHKDSGVLHQSALQASGRELQETFLVSEQKMLHAHQYVQVTLCCVVQISFILAKAISNSFMNTIPTLAPELADVSKY